MRKITTSLVLIVMMLAAAPAQSARFYEYDGNVPFIEMMLNMMSVMGILDKVPPGYPARSLGRGYYPRSSNPYANAFFAQKHRNKPGNRNRNSFSFEYEDDENPSVFRDALTAPRSQLEAWEPLPPPRFTHGRRIEGLWVSPNGEMFGIKHNRFLWNDGQENYLTGTFRLDDGYIIADIPSERRQAIFRYQLDQNELRVRDGSGREQIFERMRSPRS